jgi:hypothetical protein
MSTPDLFLYSSNNTELTSFLNVQFNSLKTKRERVRKESIRVEVKRKHLGESERRLISEGEKSILLEGTQAMPARPYDKDGMGVKT